MKSYLKKVVAIILTLEARILIARFRPQILMVTGSVGKTSAKDAIYTALKAFTTVRKSQKSFNSDIGVPLTILNLKNGWNNPILWLLNIIVGLIKALTVATYPRWLILEVGADQPGDLAKITEWLKPDAVVVTRFPEVPVHVQLYGDSIDSLIKEESLPALALKSHGVLILNDDDEKVMDLGHSFRGRVITYGLTPRANVYAEVDSTIYANVNGREVPTGMTFKVCYQNEKRLLELHDCLGVQHIYPVLSAIATAFSLKSELDRPPTFEALDKAFEGHRAPLGRMRILPGIKSTIIIDDSYNSSPVAAEWALQTLKGLKVAGRRIAVLGDMKELGKYSRQEHLKIGTLAAQVCNILITVGMEARIFAEGALDTLMDEKNIYQFENSKEAGKFLESIIRPGDVILIKGSQSLRMERAVEEIMLHPENKEKLLVRQEREWGRR